MATKSEIDTKKLLYGLFDEGSAFMLDDSSDSGVITAWGSADGNPVYAFAQDAATVDGAFGSAASAAVCKLLDLAAKTGSPVVGIYNCAGAKLGEGAGVLTSLGEFMRRVNALSGVVPQISVITGSCGGSMAMIACAADIVIAGPDAELFLGAGEDGKTAADGSVWINSDTAENAVAAAKKLLGYLPANNLDAAPIFDFSEPADGELFDTDSFTELGADFGKTTVTGFATVAGQSVGVVKTASDNGSISGCGMKKAAAFIRLCDAYSLPVISVIDATGFGSGCCGKGLLTAAKSLSQAYAESTCSKVSVITGSAIGAVYMAMAGKSSNADIVLAYENAVISPLPVSAEVLVAAPELLDNCKSEQERKAVIDEYARTAAGAAAAKNAGLVDAVVNASTARSAVISALCMLSGKRESRLPKKHGLSAF